MYLWFKAFHIIFVICWFAGLFYLPRLFVHHAQSTEKAAQERLKIMEDKLYRFTTPLMFLAIGFGLAIVALNWPYYLKQAHWFHAKFLLVLFLIVYHFYCGHIVRLFAQGGNQRSHVFYRVFNEIPVLFLFAIVILAVVKPF